MMGDSGGNIAGMRSVAQDLSALWNGAPGVFHIPEDDNWSQPGVSGGPTVRQFTLGKGVQEKYDADGIHDEYGITAVSMAFDPKAVRYEERLAANKTTINGISILPKEKTIAMGKAIVEWRADIAVEAIRKATSGSGQ